MGSSVQNILSAAKEVAKHAENFDKSIQKQSGHEFSATPYSLVRNNPPKPKPEPKGIGAELAVKANNVKEYTDFMNKK